MRELLRHRNARLYLIGQAFSGLGDSALWLATAIWVKELTGSSAAAGLTMFFFAASSLAGPLLGVMVDRVRRARLLILTNLVGAAVVLPLLLVGGASQVWLVYSVMFAYGLISKIIGSAQSALLASILPRELLASANGIMRSTREALRIVAPLVGAGLFVWQGPVAVVLLDALTFVVAAGCLVLMRVREEAPGRTEKHLGREIAAGARYIAGHRVLRWLVIGFGVATLAFGFNESGLFDVLTDGLGLDPAFVGVTGMVQGAAAVLIGPFAGALNKRLGELRLVRIGLIGYGLSLALLAVPSLPVLLLSMVIAGVSLPLAGVGLLTCVQLSTPQRLQGRVFSAVDVVVSLPLALSIAAGAGLLGLVGYRWLFLLGGAILLVGALLTLYSRGLRAVAPDEDEPTDVPEQEPATPVTPAAPAVPATSGPA